MCNRFDYFRYLQECGFVHSAFSFAHESMLRNTGLRAADRSLPPGALVTFLQKGLQYVGIEEKLRKQQESKERGKDSKKASQSNDDGFSILSQTSIAAISRRDPPLQLNVPPATAAAAVKARLEAEAKIQKEREKQRKQRQAEAKKNGASARADYAEQEQHASAAPSGATSAASHSSAMALADQNAMAARQALVAQQAIQLQQQQMAAAAGGLGAFAAPQQQTAAEILAMQNAQQLAEASNLAEAARAMQSGATQQNSPTVKRSNKRQKLQNASEEIQRISETMAGLASQAGLSTQEQTEIERNNRAAAHVQSTQPGKKDTRAPSQQEFRPIQGGEAEHVNGQVDGGNGSKMEIEDSHGLNGDRIPATNAEVTDSLALPPNADDVETNTPPNQILKLEMHESEVFMCAWNPIFTDLIATGSGDASARIWQVGGIKAAAGLTTVKLLPHGSDPRDRKNKDVTTLEWSSDGTLLATGSYDGVARVWARNGALIHTLRGHTGPIFSLKWNKQGNFLLSGSYDKTTIVWDVSGSTGFVEQQFTEHQAPALDVDWKDNLTFASCSTDKTVHICRVGVSRPLKVYVGHADEVNAVKWDPSGRYLASCSDDCTAKIWDVESDRKDPLYDLKDHEQEIYTVKWSPTGPGSKNPQKKSLLATASFDGSVRLWSVDDGSCYRVFNRHKDSVYSVAFAPSGDYLASGSLAGQMYIWDIEKKKHIKSYKGKGDIFEVAWNKEESRVAACFSSNVVAIVDFDRPKS